MVEFYSEMDKFQIQIGEVVEQITLDAANSHSMLIRIPFCPKQAGWVQIGEMCFTGCVNHTVFNGIDECKFVECQSGTVPYFPEIRCVSQSEYYILTGQIYIQENSFLNQFECNNPGQLEGGRCSCPEDYQTVNYALGLICTKNQVFPQEKLPKMDQILSQIFSGYGSQVEKVCSSIVQFISGKFGIIILGGAFVIFFVGLIGTVVRSLQIFGRNGRQYKQVRMRDKRKQPE